MRPGPPMRQAASQVALEAGGSLVALLRLLGEQLQDDRRDRRRDTLLTRSAGAAAAFWRCGNAPIPSDRPPRTAKSSGEHLVEGDAERVEVAAGVDRAVHAAGLLGRHVGERAGDGLGRIGRLALARQARGDAEPGKPHLALPAPFTRMWAGLRSLWIRPRW